MMEKQAIHHGETMMIWMNTFGNALIVILSILVNFLDQIMDII